MKNLEGRGWKLKRLLEKINKKNRSCSCYESDDFHCNCQVLHMDDFVEFLEICLGYQDGKKSK